MTKEQAKSTVKEYWQPITSLILFVFALGGFYATTKAYSEDIVELKLADKMQTQEQIRMSEKQNQYNTDIAVIKNQIVNLNENFNRALKRGSN